MEGVRGDYAADYATAGQREGKRLDISWIVSGEIAG